MSKHTPGRWARGRKQPHGAGVLCEPHGISVAWCPTGMVVGVSGARSIGADEAFANARLIASAPDLLEALRALLLAIDTASAYASPHFDGFNTVFRPTIQAARDAVAKAEGE